MLLEKFVWCFTAAISEDFQIMLVLESPIAHGLDQKFLICKLVEFKIRNIKPSFANYLEAKWSEFWLFLFGIFVPDGFHINEVSSSTTILL